MTIPDSGAISARGPGRGRRMGAGDRARWIALAVVCLAMLMNALDGSIVNVALPDIQRSLHFTQSGLTWVVDAYLITFGSFLLMAGRLGDLIGRKKVFLVGVALFTLASIACGSAGSQNMLVAARFVQGIGGALSSSVIIAIIVTEFPRADERAKAMSAYIFVAVGGGSIGLLAGGVLTQALSWHWIFFVNVPIGIATLILGRLLIVENIGIGIRQGVDVVGSVLVTASLMVGIYGIVTASRLGWGSTETLVLLGVAVVLLVSFAVLESRLANPIMPLRIFKLRSLTGSSIIRGFIATGMFSTFFIGALYLEHVLHYSPIRTGLAFMPATAGMATMSSGLAARLVNRFGPRPVMYPGILTGALGLTLLALAGRDPGYFPQVFLAFFLLGLGAGAAMIPLLQIAMAEVPKEDAGLASGIVNVSTQMAAALGLAILSTIATNQTKTLLAHGQPLAVALTDGYRLALLIAAACVLVGLLVAPIVLRTRETAEEEQARMAENMQDPVAHEHLVL
jgi:EmrB/QacA subfamily drug resistance transporter